MGVVSEAKRQSREAPLQLQSSEASEKAMRIGYCRKGGEGAKKDKEGVMIKSRGSKTESEKTDAGCI